MSALLSIHNIPAWQTGRSRLETGWRRCTANAGASTAAGSMINIASASCGGRVTPTTWKSSTTIREGRNEKYKEGLDRSSRHLRRASLQTGNLNRGRLAAWQIFRPSGTILDESSSRTRSSFGGSDGQTGEGQSQNGRLIRIFNGLFGKGARVEQGMQLPESCAISGFRSPALNGYESPIDLID